MQSSTLGWIDFSQKERQRVDRILKAFSEPGTVDELGFGQVRDRLSELLAPGITTIQTRVRYMLFIPWIFRQLEERRTAPDVFRRRLQQLELRLIYSLEENEAPTAGIIGVQARERLQRWPSTIYWGGMGRWGLRLFRGSLGEYIQGLSSFYRRHDSVVWDEDGEPAESIPPGNWHQTPEPPEKFLEGTDFNLTTEEANYLIEKVTTHLSTRDSLFAQLAWKDRLQPVECDAPWEHPLVESLPCKLQQIVVHARNFSKLTNCAMLLYNRFLAGLTEQSRVQEEMEEQLARWWAENITGRGEELAAWDLTELWQVVHAARGPSINYNVKRFVTQLLRRVRAAQQLPDLYHANMFKFLMTRERGLKGARSKLANESARADWCRPTGIDPMTYRWPQVRSYLNDFYLGLHGREDEANA